MLRAAGSKKVNNKMSKKQPKLQEGRLYSAWDFADITDRVIIRQAKKKPSTQSRKKNTWDEMTEFRTALLWAYSDEAIFSYCLRDRVETRRRPLHRYETPIQRKALKVYRTDKEVRDEIRGACLQDAEYREELRQCNDSRQAIYIRAPQGVTLAEHVHQWKIAEKAQMIMECVNGSIQEHYLRSVRGEKRGFTYAYLLELYQYGGEGFGNRKYHLQCYNCHKDIPVARNCFICNYLYRMYDGKDIFELSLGCNIEEHQTQLLEGKCYDCYGPSAEEEGEELKLMLETAKQMIE